MLLLPCHFVCLYKLYVFNEQNLDRSDVKPNDILSTTKIYLEDITDSMNDKER